MSDTEHRLAAKVAFPSQRPSQGELSYLGQLDRLAAMGFTQVQTFYDEGFTREAAASFHAAIDERGMSGDGMHYDYGTRLNLAALIPADRRREVERTIGDAVYCASLGVSFVVVHPAGKYPKKSPQEFEALAESLTELHDALAPRGIEILVENSVPNELSPDVGPLVGILDDLDLPLLGLCLDTGHAHLSGDVADMIRRGGRWIKDLHLHDNHGGPKDEHLAPFCGTIDWRAAMKALRDVSYSRLYTFETGDVYSSGASQSSSRESPLRRPDWLKRFISLEQAARSQHRQ